MSAARILALLGALAATALPLSSQVDAAKLERMLERAQTGAPAVRGQAAQRLVRMGAVAAERLRTECGSSPKAMARLGPELVEVLGAFGDPQLRAQLWTAVRDRDFPWRPAAARSLAESAVPAEVADFTALLGDPLAAVRVAAVRAWEVLDLREREELLREHLADESGIVRRRTAALLHRWGRIEALAWLLEDLRREDAFFDFAVGKRARFEAFQILRRQLGGELAYQPSKPPGDPDNQVALAALEQRVAGLCGGSLPELPAVARAGRATPGDVIGLELRSCRRGEFLLRWNAADVLYIGDGKALRIELPAGTVARLVERVHAVLESVGSRRYWGAPGCDIEQFHFRLQADQRAEVCRISKGPDAVANLRPAALGELARLLLESLPEGGGDSPRSHALRTRVHAALLVLGGPLPGKD